MKEKFEKMKKRYVTEKMEILPEFFFPEFCSEVRSADFAAICTILPAGIQNPDHSKEKIHTVST